MIYKTPLAILLASTLATPLTVSSAAKATSKGSPWNSISMGRTMDVGGTLSWMVLTSPDQRETIMSSSRARTRQ